MLDGPLDNLVRMLGGMPGLGRRSARRIALHMLCNKDTLMLPLAAALRESADSIHTCPQCGNLDTRTPCRICRDPKREEGLLCVIAGIADLWAIERTQAYKGRYHVLGGVLSALDGIGPDELSVGPLIQRIGEEDVQEVILALSATVDGQSTAHYLSDLLAESGVKVTRLAHGVPVGGELDYLDDGTITTALRARAVC